MHQSKKAHITPNKHYSNNKTQAAEMSSDLCMLTSRILCAIRSTIITTIINLIELNR